MNEPFQLATLPAYLNIVFGLTTIITIGLFYLAANRSKSTLLILVGWLIIQAVIALSGFYTVTDSVPPRFLLMVLPPVLFIIGLFSTMQGRQYLDHLNAGTLTILHTIRIPVELVLFCLFVNKAIPELMTFEGRNFDILAGLSAPIIFYFGFKKRRIGKRGLLLWNFFGLGLLLNIVINAVLSAPFPFQQFAFDQPNIAVLYFPFNWLPACVVPLVALSHLATMRQLMLNGQKK